MNKPKICPTTVTLTEKDTARYIGMSEQFLRQDRMNGPRRNHSVGPPFIKMGRSVRYLIDDLDSWLQENRVSRSHREAA